MSRPTTKNPTDAAFQHWLLHTVAQRLCPAPPAGAPLDLLAAQLDIEMTEAEGTNHALTLNDREEQLMICRSTISPTGVFAALSITPGDALSADGEDLHDALQQIETELRQHVERASTWLDRLTTLRQRSRRVDCAPPLDDTAANTTTSPSRPTPPDSPSPNTKTKTPRVDPFNALHESEDFAFISPSTSRPTLIRHQKTSRSRGSAMPPTVEEAILRNCQAKAFEAIREHQSTTEICQEAVKLTHQIQESQKIPQWMQHDGSASALDVFPMPLHIIPFTESPHQNGSHSALETIPTPCVPLTFHSTDAEAEGIAPFADPNASPLPTPNTSGDSDPYGPIMYNRFQD